MQGTRGQSEAATPKTYILDFCRDEQDGCALTARINDVRFYIVVDPARLKTRDNDKVLKEYQRRLSILKKIENPEKEDAADIKDDSSDRSVDRDSGVDVSANQSQSEAEAELQNWLLSCFGYETARLAPAPTGEESMLLEEWYEAPVHYFEVEAQGTTLYPKPVEENDEHCKRIDELFPELPLPKTLRQLGIPSIAPSDLTVITTIDDPPPIHPSTVQSIQDGKRYHFKPVDPTQPQPTKREIQYHHDIQSRGLHEEFNVPQLHGLVSAPGSNTKIMGMIFTLIEDPTPLTKLLDSEVDESKRKRWAKEAKRIVKALHKHNIVWGDAKADNLMVDKNDDLWIIDFGGSYTDGWVDPDNMETTEGDQEATEKIMNCLKDPENATFDMEEEDKRREEERKQEESREDQQVRSKNAQSGRNEKIAIKRKRDGEEDINGDFAEPMSKNAKMKEFSGPLAESRLRDEKYCFCDGPNSEKMVGCDNSGCSRKWFHLDCLGLKEAPEVEPWYCEECDGIEK